METRAYRSCCHASALTPAATFCGECGTPLTRCIAYAECYGLVGPLEPCAVCVGAEMALEAGAVTRAPVGHGLSLPLVLRNTASIARPLWVTGAWMRRGGGEFAPVDLPLETLEAGQERAFAVETGPLDGGTAAVEIALALGSRFKGYEEAYLYGGTVRVTGEAEAATTINQTIDLKGARFGTGGLVNTKLDSDLAAREPEAGSAKRVDVGLHRFERFERAFGLRGYAATGMRVPRSVDFAFHGFEARHAPARMAIGSRGALVMGRNGRAYDAERNPDPSDVTLRVAGADGATDAEASRMISRRHLDLMVLNERLCVHARGANAIAVNGEAVAAPALRVLEDGDAIAPLAKRGEALTLRLRFAARPDGVVETVNLTREGTR